MNVTAVSNYFKRLAEKHIDIQHTDTDMHYFRDMAEAIDKLKTKGKTPAVIMGPPAFYPFDKNLDNEQEVTAPVLLILDKVSNNTSIHDKYAAYDKCKAIADDFISMLKKDGYDGSEIINIDIETIKIELVGPVLDNYYGVEMELEFNSDCAYDYKPDKWINQ